jgi:hypothetical protein
MFKSNACVRTLCADRGCNWLPPALDDMLQQPLGHQRGAHVVLHTQPDALTTTPASGALLL